MRPIRDWMPLGRPIGEWVFLVVMTALGANALRNAITSNIHGMGQSVVQGCNLVIGISALGIVVATRAGRVFGIRLIWLFALAVTIAAPAATWVYGNPSGLEALAAMIVAAPFTIGVVWYGSRRLYASITQRQWPALLADHASAADEFVAAISGLDEAEWTARPSPEAWSPAEITEHLARTYAQYAGESRGKNSLRIRLGPVPRTLVRLFVKPRLLAGGAFPKAKAPRTLRPSGGPTTPADGVALFRATGEACLRDLGILAERRPYRTLVHPFFGALPLYEALRFASHHIRHHRRQLPR